MIGKFRSSPRLLAVSVIALAVAVGALAGATIDRTLNRYPGAAIELTDPAPVPPRPEGDELREGRLERSPEGHRTGGMPRRRGMTLSSQGGSGPPHHSGRRYLDRLSDQLSLTEEQRSLIESLLSEQQERIREIRREERRRSNEIITETREAIIEILTPEQRSALEQDGRRLPRGMRP